MDAVSGKTVGRFTTNRGTTPTIPHLWHKYNPFILRLQGIFYRPFLPIPSFFHSFSHFSHDLQNICSTFDPRKRGRTQHLVSGPFDGHYISFCGFLLSETPFTFVKTHKRQRQISSVFSSKNQTSSLTSAAGCIFSAEAARKRMRDSFTSSTAAWMASSVRRRASSA